MTSPRLVRSTGDRPGIGVVHLGPGAFFRAHGAVYFDQAMAQFGGDWGVVAVSLRSPDQRDRLAPQAYAYTAVEQGPDGPVDRVIEVLEDILVAAENPVAVIGVLADPRIQIVTLTITEKGYCHIPATGRLDAQNTDILHDIDYPQTPRSAVGYLVAALAARRSAGLRPFTAMSCDNLPANGKVLQAVVIDFARKLDPDLADWIAAEGRFPSTMVDCIVPATTPTDIANLTQRAGYEDQSPVMHEPFRQWVIEDRFVDGARPDLASVGAQLVSDVAPFEMMKLRCLNGTHSALAYLGYLAGHQAISDVVGDPVFAAYVRRVWDTEIIPMLMPPADTDLSAYTRQLFARYANPSIRHRTWQIAMDGSQKLPQRILGTVRDLLNQGRGSPGLTLAIAAWMRYAQGLDEQNGPIDVRDPLSDRFAAIAARSMPAKDTVEAFLSLEEVFSPKLARNDRFRTSLVDAYQALVKNGARRTAQLLYQ